MLPFSGTVTVKVGPEAVVEFEVVAGLELDGERGTVTWVPMTKMVLAPLTTCVGLMIAVLVGRAVPFVVA